MEVFLINRARVGGGLFEDVSPPPRSVTSPIIAAGLMFMVTSLTAVEET